MAALGDAGPPEPLAAVYVHVPFCHDRCTYCAFPTVADDPRRHEELVTAVLAEARRSPPAGRLHSLYLGGGTPGLLAPRLLGSLIEGLRSLYSFSDDVELTIEANPANVSSERLGHWRALGVTRVSLGVQTFQDEPLRALARRHDGAQAAAALEMLAADWRGNWSADLLVGWRGQDASTLLDDVGRLLAFDPPHVSVYGLTVEPGTPLARLAARGHAVTAPTECLERFDDTWAGLLAARGYERYEVSNFARPGHRSRHNRVYWRNASYLGLGPGATSSLHPHRWTNRPDLDGYLDAVGQGRCVRQAVERLDPWTRLLETLAVGLRTLDGLRPADLDTRFGPAWRALVRAGAERLLRSGLLRLDDEQLRIPAGHLTRADRIVLDLARGMRADEASDRAGGATQPMA